MASYNYNRGFLDSIPPVTKNLLIINVIMWVATFVLKGKGIDLDLYLGLHFWKGSDFEIWQFVTYMFMHDTSSLSAGIAHIFFNMFSLWMFGRILEPTMGRARYLTYYMVCGLGAALTPCNR